MPQLNVTNPANSLSPSIQSHSSSSDAPSFETPEQISYVKRLSQASNVGLGLACLALIRSPYPILASLAGLSIMEIQTRLSAYLKINENHKQDTREVEELSEKFAPLWLDPNLKPGEGHTSPEYLKARSIDQGFLKDGRYNGDVGEHRAITPTTISLSQTLDFIKQAVPYMTQKPFVAGVSAIDRLVRGRAPIDDNTIAGMILNSSICLFSHVEEREHNGRKGIYMTFDRGGFAMPYDHLSECYDNRLRFEVFIPEGGAESGKEYSNLFDPSKPSSEVISRLKGAEVISFQVGRGDQLEEVKSQRDRMHFTLNFVALVTHPLIHSYSDAYINRVKSAHNNGDLEPGFESIMRYGNAFNDLASFPGFLIIGHETPWFAKLQSYNARLPMPSGREHFRSALKLKKYSRTYHFLVESHKALAAVWKDNKFKNVGEEGDKPQRPSFGGAIDREAFFQGSINHSLDHMMVGEFVRTVDVKDGEIFKGGFQNITSDIFYRVTDPQLFGSNRLRDHASNKHPQFYQDLYKRLSAIDKKLADVVSLGISE